MGKKVAAFWIWLGLCMAYSCIILAQDKEPAFTYISPEGIRFQSYSTKWDLDKLKGLYEMLLHCEHGEELAELKQVALYPDRSVGKSGYRVGYYNIKNKSIDLYEVDALPIERTLIHEYGHHFTYYWLQKKEGIYPSQLTEASQWSQIRRLDGFPIRWAGTTLPYSHKWDPEEIMAEDYVLLFGIDSRPLPDRPSDVVNWLRHENDYIPSVLSIPAVRSYWQTAAGLPPKPALKMPVLQQWELVKDETPDEAGPKIHVAFSSAAPSNEHKLMYGIRIMGFGEQGGIPVSITTGLEAEGRGQVEASLDMRPLTQELQTFYLHIQVWALEPESKQIMYTPYYMNWFSFDTETGTLKPMTLPLDKQGLRTMLKNEGMESWPLVLMYLNGKPYNAVRKYQESGVDYIPLRLFSDGDDANQPLNSDGRPLDVQFQQRSVKVQMNQDEAWIDGKSVKLGHFIKKLGSEPVVAVSELPQLFGVVIQWEGDGSGSIVQMDTP
ncbi:hypothetical protein GCM10023310_40340 [Paenibacillus vulneris]|uniref:Stalk domain-containing protein n=1 Tax=Paenibacillus vulneris TaxID=1133364 RepID=A0ABW3UUV4_9BACL